MYDVILIHSHLECVRQFTYQSIVKLAGRDNKYRGLQLIVQSSNLTIISLHRNNRIVIYSKIDL
jgi:hypothetical protein